MNQNISTAGTDGFRCLDQRSGKERRSKRLSNVLWLFRTGRRRVPRRQDDRRKLHLLDYYSPNIFYVLVLVLFLSLTDAALTLWLMDNGAVELNPVMAYFIAKGTNVFIAVKYLFTSISVVIAVLLHYAFLRYFRFQFKMLLHVFASFFAAVVLWELVLLVRYVL